MLGLGLGSGLALLLRITRVVGVEDGFDRCGERERWHKDACPWEARALCEVGKPHEERAEGGGDEQVPQRLVLEAGPACAGLGQGRG